MDVVEQAALARRAQAGDADAFGQLYQALIEPIYRFVFYKTFHTETTEDITSQVFFKTLDTIASFNPNKGSFSTWVYQIARHTVIDHFRTQKNQVDIQDAWDIGEDSMVQRDVDAHLRLEAVRGQMQKLPSETRDLLILRLWEELSYAEIAQILGKSEAACKMSFSRAIRDLRAQLPAFLTLCYLLSFRS